MAQSEQEVTFNSNIVFNTITEFANFLVRAVISIIIARALGPAGRGEYTVAQLLPNIMLTFTFLGIGEASATLIGKNKYPVDKVLGTVMTFILFFTGILGIVYFGFQSTILPLTKHALSTRLYALAFFIIPLTYLWSNTASMCLGLGLVKQVGAGRLLNNIVFLLIAAVLFFLRTLDPFSALLVYILAWSGEIVFLVYFILRQFPRLPMPIIDIPLMKEQLRFGTKYFLGSIFGNLNRRLDAYIVVFFLGKYSLGIYAVAVGVSEFLLTLPAIFSRVTFSLSARSIKNENAQLIASSIRQIIFLMALGSLVFAAILKPFIVTFYSDKFIESYLPALILLPGIISYGTAMVLGFILVGLSKPLEATKAAGLTCIFTVVLDILLVPSRGVLGASIASTLSYTVGAAYLAFIFKRDYQLTFSDILWIKKSDILAYKTMIQRFVGLFRKSEVPHG